MDPSWALPSTPAQQRAAGDVSDNAAGQDVDIQVPVTGAGGHQADRRDLGVGDHDPARGVVVDTRPDIPAGEVVINVARGGTCRGG